ncbi:MAG TPA: NAD(P)H-dependent oxidoreductase [Clostridia bacterium]|nr:NAD(P)H-dependent oxidoreductase [Clostridia bacterium]
MLYLIINGSPHKGNTWKLALRATEYILKEDPAAEFDTVHLAEAGLPFCIGCSACFRLGHEKCPHSDIVGEIIRKIEAANGVIVLSSTFNMRETALLKNLFDHLCFMLHRPRFFQSKALVLTTTGGVGAKQSAKSIAGFFKGIGFNRCYSFGAAAYSWNDYTISGKTAQRLEKTVRRFQRDVASKKLHSPSTLFLIPYNLFRGMSLACVKGTEYEAYDGIHWTEECRKNGVYDRSVPVPFYKKPLGQLFYGIGKMAGKSMVVTYKK